MITQTLLDIQKIIYLLDMIGTSACAAAASVLAKRLNFDMFGAIFVAFIGSVGGGTLRDLLINRHPIFWLHDLNYLYLIIVVSLIVQVFFYAFEELDRVIRWFDALGLAAFTVIGVQASLTRGMAAPIAVLMGAFTASIGGMMRDIVCRQIPLVLRQEIYITASVLGSSVYLLMLKYGINPWIRSTLTIVLIFTIRMLAVYRNWNLPDISLPKNKTH